MTVSSLRVVTPPAKEPVSLADAKAHLRIDHDDDDALIPGYIAVARDRAEMFLNRALITRTLRYTAAPSPPISPVSGNFFNPALVVLPLGWPQFMQQPIQLPMSPVQSIASVTQRQRDGTTTTLDPASAYYVDVGNEPGSITLRGVYQTPGIDLAVTYVAGYGDDPSAVPVSIVHAIKLMLTFFYERRGDDEGEMPKAAEMLMWPYRMVGFA